MASRMAERSSVSVSAWLKPESGRFQARRAAVTTASAEGVRRWPWPQKTPATAMRPRAAEVVSSEPRWAYRAWRLRNTMSRPASTAEAPEEGEGAQAAFFAAPLPCEADEQPEGERQTQTLRGGQERVVR